MKHIFLKIALVALLPLLLLSPQAWAAGACTGSGSTSWNPRPNNSDVVVPSKSPLGTTAWSTVLTTNAISITCTGGAYVTGYHVGGSRGPVPGYPHIYKTDVPWLGVKVVEMNSLSTVENAETSWFTSAPNFTKTAWTVKYQVSLVVVGPVYEKSSSMGGETIFTVSFRDSNGNPVGGTHSLKFQSFDAKTGGSICSISTSNVAVPLGTWQASAFGGVGSGTTPASFNIQLANCPGTVKYQIDPATSVVPGTPQLNTVATLNAASTATGVGVQLLDGSGTPLALGTPFALGGSMANRTIPLKARYYQTGGTVGAGSANAAMTFTITYQ